MTRTGNGNRPGKILHPTHRDNAAMNGAPDLLCLVEGGQQQLQKQIPSGDDKQERQRQKPTGKDFTFPLIAITLR
jgi:hypothetical protein